MFDKNLLSELQPYRCKIYAIILADIVLAGVIIARCYYLADIINGMLFFQLSLQTAVPQLVLLFVLFLAETGLGYGIHAVTHSISVGIRRRIRRALVYKLSESSPLSSIYDNTDLLPLLTRGIDSLDAYFAQFLPQMIVTVVIPLVILPAAFYCDWISGFIFLLTMPLIPFFMILIGKKAQVENNRQWTALSRLSELFMNLLSGMSVIKVYNQTKNQLKKAVDTGELFSQAVLRVLRIAFLSAFFLELIATLSIAIIAVNIGFRLLSGQTIFLAAFFILLLAPEFYKPLRQTGSMFHQAMDALTNSPKIYNLLDDKITKEQFCKKKIHLDSAPCIVFTGVGFNYNANRENVLRDINMEFAAGKVTALIGRSGAGKSTVFSLLMKFAKPDKGKILINGEDIGTIATDSLRENIAYVAQRAYIFNASIRENICLGRKVNAERLQKAISAAGLTKVIAAMPQQLDTIIGDDSRKLSSGQMRRLSLARAFLSDAPLLLLDEPLESLDSITEKVVKEGIRQLSEGKTVVIIAHRLASIKQADAIYVMDRGKIVEHGSDSELKRNKALYYKMVNSTMGGSLI
ncbi:thiol reductant ABC exporter subunit CydD [Pectinatus frisingensis]|uniref:thiol reductant ABC exporter subunit CydD n=1 Tax=Pectinatus frisingensis TaxID=865 RepID=UPI0018C5E8C8|nr:thiol reductant ABC exporter subunit CydD [Pectinatus frisingensis]